MTQYQCSIEVRLHPEGDYQPYGHNWIVEAQTEDEAYELAKKEAARAMNPDVDYEVVMRVTEEA